MHNLYFPWVRILLMIGILSGVLYSVQWFNPQPIDVELHEEDFKNHQVLQTKWNSDIQYLVNGTDRRYGNLIAMEPYFLPLDFHSPDSYRKAIEPVLEKAKSEKAMDKKTLVLFPEHVGTGLILLGEKRPAFDSEKIKDSVEFLLNYYNTHPDTISDTKEWNLSDILQSKKDLIAETYHNTFSSLAKEYNVNIVAGSIILPNPSIKKGKLISEPGDIYNVSVIYLSSGKAIEPLVKKVNLSEWEKEFVKPGDIKQDFIAKVPYWTVGILIGEDSLYESVYQSIGSKKMDGIISPASSFQDPDWTGLGVEKGKSDDLWIQHGVGKWISRTRGKDHLQVFWKGEGWDLNAEGESYTNRSSDSLERSGQKQGPKVLNLYF